MHWVGKTQGNVLPFLKNSIHLSMSVLTNMYNIND